MNSLNKNIISIKSLNHKIIYMIMRVITIMIGLTVVKRLFKSFLFLVDTLRVSTPSFSIFSDKRLVKECVILTRKRIRYLTSLLSKLFSKNINILFCFICIINGKI